MSIAEVKRGWRGALRRLFSVSRWPITGLVVSVATLGCMGSCIGPIGRRHPPLLDIEGAGPVWYHDPGARFASVRYRLSAGSDFEREIRGILQDRQRIWHVRVDTLAPCIWLKGDGWSLNIWPSDVTLNYTAEKGSLQQVHSGLETSEWYRILSALKRLPAEDNGIGR